MYEGVKKGIVVWWRGAPSIGHFFNFQETKTKAGLDHLNTYLTGHFGGYCSYQYTVQYSHI